MRRVVCIDLSNTHDSWFRSNPLTLGKIYYVIPSPLWERETIRVTNDLGNEQGYCSFRFKELEDILKLNINTRVI